MSDMLPKLFFTHFRPTSFVAECEGNIVGFIVGFVSQTSSAEAYIHFVGVSPDFRKGGLGRTLYEKFFEVTSKLGCQVVRCVTSPVNKSSISFHQRMGFVAEPGDKTVDGISVFENYDGEGEDRVLFLKRLNAIEAVCQLNEHELFRLPVNQTCNGGTGRGGVMAAYTKCQQCKRRISPRSSNSLTHPGLVAKVRTITHWPARFLRRSIKTN
jgi:GNAT superfamily N-acetyltransferase